MSSPLYPRKPIFQLDFSQGEYGVRRAGGVPNNVEFDGEKAVFDGQVDSSDYIIVEYPIIEEAIYSVRIKFTLAEDADLSHINYLYSGFKNVWSNNVRIDTDCNLQMAGFLFAYLNGENINIPYSVNKGDLYDLIVILTAVNIKNFVFCCYADTYRLGFKGSVDLIEIYDGELTAEEVSLLYQSKLYQKPTLNSLLDITSARGVIEDKAGNSFTNNGVEVVRDGSQWVMKYSSANITASPSGSYKAVAFWLKPDSDTEQIIRIGSNDITVSSGTLTASWADDIFVNGVAGTSITERKWQRVVVRVDTALNISSIDIGHTSSYYNGLLANIKVVESMTDEQIMNDFNAERKAFNV